MTLSGVAAKLTQLRLLKSVDGLLLTEAYGHVVAAGLVKLNFLGPELPISAEVFLFLIVALFSSMLSLHCSAQVSLLAECELSCPASCGTLVP